MWIFTKYGFFSVVATADEQIQIRARSRRHLENLLRQFPKRLTTPIVETPQADYGYRVIVDSEDWDKVAYELANEIDYSNFKNECRKNLGGGDMAYQNALLDIWETMRHYQDKLRAAEESKDHNAGRTKRKGTTR